MQVVAANRAMASVTDLLFALRRKGVKVWADDGRLRYHSTASPPTEEEMSALRAQRGEILALLEQQRTANSIEAQLAPRDPGARIPLTFSQQWWWHGWGLESHASMRMVAGAVRLSGHLSLTALEESLTVLVARHESLRTRIVISNSVPEQKIDDPSRCCFEFLDLSSLSIDERTLGTEQAAARMANEPFRLENGPMFLARLIRMKSFEHVLIVALDHMISDAASLAVVWRDLFAFYEQSVRGSTGSLAAIRVQFPDYAVWQHTTHPSWMNEHSNYWTQRLAGAEPIRICPTEGREGSTVQWIDLPIRLGASLSATLRESSRLAQTTIVMTVLAAYIASLMRVSKRTDVVIPFITAGRLHGPVHDMIGFFGTPMLLRMQLGPDDRLLDLLDVVTLEYRNAYEHSDSCRVAAELPELAANPTFNWIPQNFDTNSAARAPLDLPDGSLTIERYPLSIPMIDTKWGADLALIVSDTADGITGFIRHRSSATVDNALQELQFSLPAFAQALASNRHARLSDVSLGP